MKSFLAATLAALCLLALTGCGNSVETSPSTSSASAASAGSATSSQAAASGSAQTAAPPTPDEQATEMIRNMSLAEKVGQLFFARCPEEGAASDADSYHLGGFVLFGRDFQNQTANEIIQTLAAYQAAATIPLLLGTDEEGGTVVRVSSNSHLRSEKFPSPQRLYALGGMEEIVSSTHERDLLLQALGINVNLAPVADVSTNSADFIYPRSFGLDATQTASYVSAVVSQMNTDNMGSVLKHFPGYGNNVDTHTGIATDQRPIETFTSSDFLPFQAGFRTGNGKTAVLVSHNIMTAVDDTLPASLSAKVHDLLRRELSFDGVVMTDDLAMDAVQSYVQNGQVAVLAVEAGNDLLLTTDYRTQIPQVIEAVESGQLDESLIDAACRRVLVWKINLGLLSPAAETFE